MASDRPVFSGKTLNPLSALASWWLLDIYRGTVGSLGYYIIISIIFADMFRAVMNWYAGIFSSLLTTKNSS